MSVLSEHTLHVKEKKKSVYSGSLKGGCIGSLRIFKNTFGLSSPHGRLSSPPNTEISAASCPNRPTVSTNSQPLPTNPSPAHYTVTCPTLPSLYTHPNTRTYTHTLPLWFHFPSGFSCNNTHSGSRIRGEHATTQFCLRESDIQPVPPISQPPTTRSETSHTRGHSGS